MKTMIAAVALASACLSAQAQTHSYLVEQWFQGGANMCRYDNGTVLNVGSRVCPLKIANR